MARLRLIRVGVDAGRIGEQFDDANSLAEYVASSAGLISAPSDFLIIAQNDILTIGPTFSIDIEALGVENRGSLTIVQTLSIQTGSFATFAGSSTAINSGGVLAAGDLMLSGDVEVQSGGAVSGRLGTGTQADSIVTENYFTIGGFVSTAALTNDNGQTGSELVLQGGGVLDVQGIGGFDTLAGSATRIGGQLILDILNNAGNFILEGLGRFDAGFTGAISIQNTGVIQGDVALSDGADVYDGAGGQLVGALHGMDGSDTLTGGSGADVLFGDLDGDVLSGGGGVDVLNGGGGADTMTGGAGGDKYYVDNAGDQVIENPGAEIDTVISSVNFTLAVNVENISLGGAANIGANGNASNNKLVGNGGNNTLKGLDGADTMNGGAGADVLYGGGGIDLIAGGAGADTFVLNAPASANNRDTIIDFNVAADTIRLEDSVFTAIGPVGALAAAAFQIGGAAATANVRIIYNPDNGKVFYDDDGSGAHAAIWIATLDAGLALTRADFMIA